MRPRKDYQGVVKPQVSATAGIGIISLSLATCKPFPAVGSALDQQEAVGTEIYVRISRIFRVSYPML